MNREDMLGGDIDETILLDDPSSLIPYDDPISAHWLVPAVALVAFLYIVFQRRPAEWESTVSFIPRTLVDGSRGWGRLMKRFRNGRMEYRRQTDDEYYDDINDSQW